MYLYHIIERVLIVGVHETVSDCVYIQPLQSQPRIPKRVGDRPSPRDVNTRASVDRQSTTTKRNRKLLAISFPLHSKPPPSYRVCLFKTTSACKEFCRIFLISLISWDFLLFPSSLAHRKADFWDAKTMKFGWVGKKVRRKGGSR